MVRFSMLGWVGAGLLMLLLTDSVSVCAQSVTVTLNPRACVKDEKTTDKCPKIQEVLCPVGACLPMANPIVPGLQDLGCVPLDGQPAVDIEYEPRNSEATVQAAKEVAFGEDGKRPTGASPVVCYVTASCSCRKVNRNSRECQKGEPIEHVIYSWKPSKFLCVGIAPWEE